MTIEAGSFTLQQEACRAADTDFHEESVVRAGTELLVVVIPLPRRKKLGRLDVGVRTRGCVVGLLTASELPQFGVLSLELFDSGHGRPQCFSNLFFRITGRNVLWTVPVESLHTDDENPFDDRSVSR